MERKVLSGARRCACGNVRRASRALTQLYDQHLKPSGLRVTQFSLLLNISLKEGISVGELAELLVMDQTTATRNLEALKKEGYIEITKQDKDARKKSLTITPKGTSALAEAMPLWDNAQDHIESRMGKTRFREFLQMLSEITTLTK